MIGYSFAPLVLRMQFYVSGLAMMVIGWGKPFAGLALPLGALLIACVWFSDRWNAYQQRKANAAAAKALAWHVNVGVMPDYHRVNVEKADGSIVWNVAPSGLNWDVADHNPIVTFKQRRPRKTPGAPCIGPSYGFSGMVLVGLVRYGRRHSLAAVSVGLCLLELAPGLLVDHHRGQAAFAVLNG